MFKTTQNEIASAETWVRYIIFPKFRGTITYINWTSTVPKIQGHWNKEGYPVVEAIRRTAAVVKKYTTSIHSKIVKMESRSMDRGEYRSCESKSCANILTMNI